MTPTVILPAACARPRRAPPAAAEAPAAPSSLSNVRRVIESWLDMWVRLLVVVGGTGRALERGQEARRVRDPAEDAALGLDHAEADLVELREVGPAAVAEDEAAVAAV